MWGSYCDGQFLLGFVCAKLVAGIVSSWFSCWSDGVWCFCTENANSVIRRNLQESFHWRSSTSWTIFSIYPLPLRFPQFPDHLFLFLARSKQHLRYHNITWPFVFFSLLYGLKLTCPESVSNLYSRSPGLLEPTLTFLGVTDGAIIIHDTGFP